MKMTRRNISIFFFFFYKIADKVNEAHYPYCGVASFGGPGSFSTHTIFRILSSLRLTAGAFSGGVGVINGRTVVSTSISAVTSIKLSSVTTDTSVCNTESSDLVKNVSVWRGLD